jgi:serine/threonine-protein kinase
MNESIVTQTSEQEKMAILPTPGEVITSLATMNTYTIGHLIGEGNFGIVYSCKDIWNNNLAAKVLKPKGTYEKIKANAETELKKLIDLRNPYITYVHDAFEYRDTFYIITEKCSQTIQELFSIKNFNGLFWLMPIARNLLQAIHYLHINNYIHQDIHLGNVFTNFVQDEMIPNEREIIQFKLGDLGVARMVHEVDYANTRAQWMLPPEIIDPAQFGLSNQQLDHRIDIYHIGLLFLQIAYSQELHFSIEEIISGKPREMALQLQEPYKSALEKALRRRVEYRTQSAMEFWKDLQLLEAGKI